MPIDSRLHQRIIVYLAMRVLQDAVSEQSRERMINTLEVRLALRCIIEHYPRPETLTTFWSGAVMTDRSMGTSICSNAQAAMAMHLRHIGKYDGVMTLYSEGQGPEGGLRYSSIAQ